MCVNFVCEAFIWWGFYPMRFCLAVYLSVVGLSGEGFVRGGSVCVAFI